MNWSLVAGLGAVYVVGLFVGVAITAFCVSASDADREPCPRCGRR